MKPELRQAVEKVYVNTPERNVIRANSEQPAELQQTIKPRCLYCGTEKGKAHATTCPVGIFIAALEQAAADQRRRDAEVLNDIADAIRRKYRTISEDEQLEGHRWKRDLPDIIAGEIEAGTLTVPHVDKSQAVEFVRVPCTSPICRGKRHGGLGFNATVEKGKEATALCDECFCR